MGAVNKQGVGKELHCGLTPGFDRSRFEWIERQQHAHHGRAQKIENVCSQRGIAHLEPVHLTQLAVFDTLMDGLL